MNIYFIPYIIETSFETKIYFNYFISLSSSNISKEPKVKQPPSNNHSTPAHWSYRKNPMAMPKSVEGKLTSDK